MNHSLDWLAGLWDGEGSIGLAATGKGTYVLQVQMSMTHLPTLQHAVDLLEKHGVKMTGPYATRQYMDHHKQAWSIRASGLGNVMRMAELLVDRAVTKREQWQLGLTWARRRIEAAGGLDEQGHVRRGGSNRKGYGPEDDIIREALSVANDSRRSRRPKEGVSRG